MYQVSSPDPHVAASARLAVSNLLELREGWDGGENDWPVTGNVRQVCRSAGGGGTRPLIGPARQLLETRPGPASQVPPSVSFLPLVDTTPRFGRFGRYGPRSFLVVLRQAPSNAWPIVKRVTPGQCHLPQTRFLLIANMTGPQLSASNVCCSLSFSVLTRFTPLLLLTGT